MPAITADPLTLPRIDLPLDTRPRSVTSVTRAPSGNEGGADAEGLDRGVRHGIWRGDAVNGRGLAEHSLAEEGNGAIGRFDDRCRWEATKDESLP